MIINIMQLIIIMSFVFAFSEFLLMLVKHSKIKNAKTRNDQGSMILIWVMITFGFIAGFFLARHDSWKPINYILTDVGLLVILILLKSN